ncbi:MAG: HAMP domain-containing protein [Alphaproteobacteria bacterium]|nr:HAMP domain-containing protein [Alphaproteobacteria bacterium]
MASDTGTATADPPDPKRPPETTRSATSWWRRWTTDWLFPARRGAGSPPRDAEAASSATLWSRRGRARRFSPLTRRILLVNTLPVAFLAGSIVFLSDYEDTLIDTELAALTLQGEVVAAAIGESAVRGGEATINRVDPEMARLLMARLTTPIGARGRIFGETGEMFGDTANLGDRQRRIVKQALPPPDAGAGDGWFRRVIDDVERQLRAGRSDGPYKEIADPVARDYPWVEQALRGYNTRTVRRADDGRLILSVAIPVQRYKQVLGALMLQRDDSDIAHRIHLVRLDLLRIAGVTLGCTILLSFFLARTIARPITRLARAADRVRLARDSKPTMPDIGARNDEIGDLSDSLRSMTDALWLRMNAIESFAADVAHELKNPLTSLRSAAEIAARIEDPEKRAKLMAIVLDDTRRLDRLISDIADSSRLDAELMRGELHVVDIEALLRSLVEAYAATTASEAGVRVELNALRGGPFRVLGHEGRYGQVFRNVIDNAISFSPKNARIVVGLMREKSAVVATIDDQGPGIPDVNVETIFRRFYSERPSAAFGRHSGLGLSICRQIVDAYGGSITAGNIKDAQGRTLGARFTVRMPLAG